MNIAEKILEDNLNNIGFSFAEQLKPDSIKLSEVRKTKKVILKAMEEYAQQPESQPDRKMLREELIKFAQQFYADEETCIHNVNEYLKSKE